MNKEQIKGRIKEAEGKIKEVTGKIIGNPNLEKKGKIQNAVGKIQVGFGDVKDEFKR